MVKKIKLLSLSIIVILVLSNCSNDDGDLNQIELGIWVSTDQTDTLDFRSLTNFYKSNPYMQNENYDYEILPKDSIQIVYRGKLFIGVEPTNHKYSLNGNEMTIDFTNKSCYGFEGKLITYVKE